MSESSQFQIIRKILKTDSYYVLINCQNNDNKYSCNEEKGY